MEERKQEQYTPEVKKSLEREKLHLDDKSSRTITIVHCPKLTQIIDRSSTIQGVHMPKIPSSPKLVHSFPHEDFPSC